MSKRTPKPTKVRLARTGHGSYVFGPDLPDGRARFHVYPRLWRDPGANPKEWELVDRAQAPGADPAAVGEFSHLMQVEFEVGGFPVAGAASWWDSLASLREFYSLPEVRQETGLQPPELFGSRATRYPSAKAAAAAADALAARTGEPFVILADGPGEDPRHVVVFAGGG